MNKINKYVLAVLGGGICWGFMGFFTRHLDKYGIDSDEAIIVRCGIAAVMFGLLLLLTKPAAFKVKKKDIWCFLGSGLLSLLFFTFCYFRAISMMDLSTAAILLYIAPTIVMLLSAILFGEKITPTKILAVVLAFAGCCLVSGIAGGVSLTAAGLLFGIGSGVGYALYTIFSRYALDRGYSSLTINFYSCLLASVGAAIIWKPFHLMRVMTDTSIPSGTSVPAWVWGVAIGVFSCFIPYLLYTYGLTGLENGKASVLASIEPVVASLVGVLYYHEKMSLATAVGIVLVLGAVVLVNVKLGTGRKGEAFI